MKKTPEDIVNEIRENCALLGWQIAMDESSPGIRGLVIGQPKYVHGIIEQLSESDDYTIYTASSESDAH